MNAQTFFDNFATIAEAPGGIALLRRMVLDLAVQGRLVEQDPNDQPAVVDLKQIARRREAASQEMSLRRAARRLPPVGASPTRAVPSGWAEVRLGDAFLVVMGNSPPGDTYNEQGQGLPLINGPVEFSASPLGRTVVRQYTTAPTRVCQEGDLLVCVRGATTGRTNIAGFDACIGRGVALVRAWEAQPFVNLLLWNLGSHLLAAGKGTTFPSISQDDLADRPILVPPLAEQERIVAKVDELMGLCDDLEVRQERRHRATARFRASAFYALTEAETPDDLRLAWKRAESNWPAITAARESAVELRQTILQLAFEGRLAGAAAQGMPRPKTTPPILDGPFPIPGHWRWAKFDEVVDSRLGKMLDKAKNTGPLRPYLRNANVQWFRFDLSDVHELRLEDAELETHSLRPGDLVICEGGEPGRLAVCDDTVSGMVFQKALHRARPRSDVDVWYLAFLLRCYAGSGYLSTFFTGATINHLTGKALASVPLPVPPIAEQRQIVARIEELTAACDQLEVAISHRAASEAALATSLTRTA